MFPKISFIAPLAVAALLATGLPSYAQQTTTPQAPTASTLPETTPGQTGTPTAPMTKSELKAQHKQQKQEEKAANANAKAAKSSAKAKKDADKAQQQQEKAVQPQS